jgi:hypothetical protein
MKSISMKLIAEFIEEYKNYKEEENCPGGPVPGIIL